MTHKPSSSTLFRFTTPLSGKLNRYVVNEMEFTGAGANMLRARSTAIGGWERFHIVYL